MIFVGPSGRSHNLENFQRIMTLDASGIPDGKKTIKRMISKGDTVVVELVWSGTHKREYLGIKPTNNRVEIQTVNIFDLKENKIKLIKGYSDMRTVDQQLRQ